MPLADGFVLASGYGDGRVARFTASGGRAVRRWQNDQVQIRLGSCTRHGERLFGVCEKDQALKCLDLASGEVLWQTPNSRYGNVIVAGDKLVTLDTKGGLVVAEAAADAYTELCRTRLEEGGPFWVTPTVADGRIYVRSNLGSVWCIGDGQP